MEVRKPHVVPDGNWRILRKIIIDFPFAIDFRYNNVCGYPKHIVLISP